MITEHSRCAGVLAVAATVFICVAGCSEGDAATESGASAESGGLGVDQGICGSVENGCMSAPNETSCCYLEGMLLDTVARCWRPTGYFNRTDSVTRPVAFCQRTGRIWDAPQECGGLSGNVRLWLPAADGTARLYLNSLAGSMEATPDLPQFRGEWSNSPAPLLEDGTVASSLPYCDP